MTKEQLIKLLQEDKMPMNTPIQIYLDCTNDDKGILSISVDELKYSKGFKSLMIFGTYEEDIY
jgi:hypothetical protein